MSAEPQPAALPTIRTIVWRGVPLHYVIPVATGLVGVALLLLGGGAAWFGAWWLTTALPISIGGLFRDGRLVAAPAGVWAVWLIVGALAGPDASLANTPILLGAALAALGAGATYLAQRAIFPATDPETLEAIRQGRTVPTMDDIADDAPAIETLPVEDGDELDPVLSEAIEMAEETEPEVVLAGQHAEEFAAITQEDLARAEADAK